MEPRVRQPVCRKCCNLPWRVKGSSCSACGLPYAEELVPIETQRASALGLAQNDAAGGYWGKGGD